MKSSTVIIIPLVVIGLIVGAVFAVKFVTDSSSSTSVAVPTPVPLPGLSDSNGKPKVGFDGIQSTQPVVDLRRALDMANDTGFSDIETLEKDASAL